MNPIMKWSCRELNDGWVSIGVEVDLSGPNGDGCVLAYRRAVHPFHFDEANDPVIAFGAVISEMTQRIQKGYGVGAPYSLWLACVRVWGCCMKVPTMDQLRIQHELAMAGAHAEWEELWRQVCAYGMAYWMGEGASTETFGRGTWLGPTPGEISFNEVMAKHLNETQCRRWPLIEPNFWLPERIDSFPRSALADAVAQSVES